MSIDLLVPAPQPANILLDNNYDVKVADFGLAAVVRMHTHTDLMNEYS